MRREKRFMDGAVYTAILAGPSREKAPRGGLARPGDTPTDRPGTDPGIRVGSLMFLQAGFGSKVGDGKGDEREEVFHGQGRVRMDRGSEIFRK